MSLSVPDSDSLLIHMRRTEAFLAEEEDWVDDSLQRATDLAQIATGLTEDPTEDIQLRVLQVGILAMAHAIFVTSGEDREAMYSPFTSERLGSYSYAKAQQAVQAGVKTEVPEFDTMVAYFTGLATGTDGESIMFAHSSEKVWKGPYGSSDDDTFGTQDPTRGIPLSADAWNQ